MTEDEARQVELVRAVESEDRAATLLTQEDRQQAEAHARARSDPLARSDSGAGDQYLARRAEFAAARLVTRHPGIAALLGGSRWPRWAGLALPLGALLAGFIANEFGTSRRLDLLAVPLLGTVAWNLLIYLWLAGLTLLGKAGAGSNPVMPLLARIAALRRTQLGSGTALHTAASSFQQRWVRLSAGLTGARVARTVHLAAALFAAGLIGGIYLRALVTEYRAGWESTFLGAQAVHALMSALLWPASLVTGVAIPPVAQIGAMHWTGPDTGGVNAGPWLHLYTATVVGLVIVPRLLLSGWQAIKAARLARNFPVPGREDFYVRRLLRSAGGAPGAARITPYAYHPAEETRAQLSQALKRALGEAAQVRFDEPVEYGAEDRWLSAQALDPGDDYHIVLFNLAATPEEENHGAFAANLAKSARTARPGTAVRAVIDEGPFRARFAGQAGLDARVAGRLDGWRQVLSAAGIIPLALNLSQPFDEAAVQRIEGGLLADGELRG